MTAKQKANNLIDSYYVLLDGFVTFEQVKICALIAVDEILDLKHIVTLRRNMHEMELEYWMEVKQEIEKL